MHHENAKQIVKYKAGRKIFIHDVYGTRGIDVSGQGEFDCLRVGKICSAGLFVLERFL